MSTNGRSIVRAGMYLRVSTAGQAEREHPLHVQEAICRSIADREYGKDTYIPKLYQDRGVSGGEAGEGLRNMVGDILRGELDVVITQSLERLTRNPEVWSSLLVKALTETDLSLLTDQGRVDLANVEDRLLAHILIGVGEFQRLHTAVKVRAGLRQRAEEGYPTTKVGYGWQWEPKDDLKPNERRGIDPVPEQRQVIVWMVDRYLAGDGAPAIARELNERGVPGATGGEWNVSSVRNTIFHPVHSGQVEVPGEGRLVRGAHWEERYYDPEMYERIMAEKDRRSRRRGRSDRSSFILSGTATCALCGRNVVGANNTSRRYQCPRGWTYGVPDCDGVSCRADPLEEAVVEAILQLGESPTIRDAAKDAAAELLAARNSDLQEAIRAARQTLAGIQQRRDRWTEAYTAAEIGLERFREYEQKLVDQHERADAHLDELVGEAEDQQATAQQLRRVREALADVRQCWDGLTYEQRRQLVNLAVEELTLEPVPTGVNVVLRLSFGDEHQLTIPAAAHRDGKALDGVDALTLRELAVLALLEDGLAPIEISGRFSVSRACTHTHLYNIRRKLRVKTNEEAIRLARPRVAETRRFLPTKAAEETDPRGSRPNLTGNQMRVLQLINEGLTYGEIAERLGKSKPNIGYFATSLREKLGVRNRKQVVLKARHMGMVPTPKQDRGQGE